MSLPAEFVLRYSQAEIEREVKRLGDEVATWAAQVQADTGQDLYAIPILRGGIFFFADLVRNVSTSVDMAPIMAVGYDPESNTLNPVGVSIDMADVEPAGRHVLLVDDICDTGRTLMEVKSEFLKKGASEVRSAVLIRRKEFGMVETEVDYVGIDHEGPEWFVGYGMDDKNRWRNLPEIYLCGGEHGG